MVITYNNKYYFDLLEFVKNNFSTDFYVTENNQRIFIKDKESLDKFLKTSSIVYIDKVPDGVNGVISLWKVVFDNVKRNYVKLNAKTEKSANALLSTICWTYNCDLYAKIRKDSRFINLFKDKQFRFLGDRGKEVLLVRHKYGN